MCFSISRKKEFRTSKIASEDITVYKVCHLHTRKVFSYYKRFEYKRGEVCTVKHFRRCEDCKTSIDEGFHSYSNKVKADRNMSFIFPYERICKFTIPKGTKYYYNPQTEEYVSLAIHFDRLLPKKKQLCVK